MIDDQGDTWVHQGIESLRTQADQAPTPSERSLNPQGLWRRAQDSWHHGAGQTFRDREGADQYRYRSSKGIDPWTFYEISLLPDTDQKLTSANTNLFLAVAGSRIYVADGTALKYTTDITPGTPTWTTVTGTSGAAITGLASDGFTVYIADGASIYTTDSGASSASSYNTLNSEVIGFVKGRIMVATDNIVYNVTSGSAPAALWTHPNTAFVFVGFAEGQNALYMAGWAGDKSLIYKTSIEADGTALDIPTVAGRLPDGEVIHGIGGYLGFILLGTDRGVRFCQPDGDGNLQIGPLIETGSAVRCFEGQHRYVWFGWDDYDSTSTGLGRMDLTAFPETVDTGARVPAYASDLMATTTGAVLSAATFQDIRVFTVSGVGVFAETTTRVASGTIESGLIGFGLPDPKIAISLDIRTEELVGSYSAAIDVDGGGYSTTGTQTDTDSTVAVFPVQRAVGERFELRLTLTRDVTLGPVITRWTLKATPGANDGANEYMVTPFLLHDTLRLPSGQEVHCDVKFERDAIKALRQSRQAVTYQENDQSFVVQVENFQWHPVGLRWDPEGMFRVPDGTLIVQMKRLS
jgi:hypothetical protein